MSERQQEPLTVREVEVAQLVVKGLHNKEIARRLTISERTVQTHLGNIFTKYDVSSRTELAIMLLTGTVQS